MDKGEGDNINKILSAYGIATAFAGKLNESLASQNIALREEILERIKVRFPQIPEENQEELATTLARNIDSVGAEALDMVDGLMRSLSNSDK